MKTKLYTVYDEKAQAHLTPFVLDNEYIAQRTFGDCVNDPDHGFSAHPSDYTLFEIAVFDNNTGVMVPHQTKIPLGNGLDFKKPGDEVHVLSQQQFQFLLEGKHLEESK